MGRRTKLKEIEEKKRILRVKDELQRRSLSLAAAPARQFLQFAELSYNLGRNIHTLVRRRRGC